MSDLPEAFHLVTPRGALYCLYHRPQGPHLRGKVLHVHPFAEELNLCRRPSAQFARQLAGEGYAVLQFDMHGCGDSDGEFGEATWSTWQADTCKALDELNRRCTDATEAPLWLWGVRSGALLTAHLCLDPDTAGHLLWWQPTVSGTQVLQQWLRLDDAKAWLSSETPISERTKMSAAERLQHGEAVHVAGYEISPVMATSLSAPTLKSPPAAAVNRHLLCVEMANVEGSSISMGTQRVVDLWRQAGWSCQTQSVQAPAFWQQFSEREVPDLFQACLAGMRKVNS